MSDYPLNPHPFANCIETNKDLADFLSTLPTACPIVTQVVCEAIFAPIQGMPSGQVIGAGVTTLSTPNGPTDVIVLYVRPI